MALKHIGKTIEKIMFQCQESRLLVHCTVCKTKTQLVNGQQSTTKTNKPMILGECEICGAGVFKIISTREKK